MEESEKRRERLKAMRMEAAQAEVSANVTTSAMPGCLSNPLIETPVNCAVNDNPFATPRFDFYTDPMSAFSANRRKIKDSNQSPQDCFSPPNCSGSSVMRSSSSFSGPMNSNMASPAHQVQNNYSSNQRIYETPSPYHSPGSWRSPAASPFVGYRQTTPGVWKGSGSMGSCGFASNMSSGGFPSSGFGRGGSPTLNSGRGWGRQSPGSGRGRGRGRGSHASVSAKERPELFYNKSMVADPWKFLKPVIRSLVSETSMNTADSLGSWLPKSISMKKPRLSEEVKGFSSQTSLANCLAASLEEAVNDATDL